MRAFSSTVVLAVLSLVLCFASLAQAKKPNIKEVLSICERMEEDKVDLGDVAEGYCDEVESFVSARNKDAKPRQTFTLKDSLYTPGDQSKHILFDIEQESGARKIVTEDGYYRFNVKAMVTNAEYDEKAEDDIFRQTKELPVISSGRGTEYSIAKDARQLKSEPYAIKVIILGEGLKDVPFFRGWNAYVDHKKGQIHTGEFKDYLFSFTAYMTNPQKKDKSGKEFRTEDLEQTWAIGGKSAVVYLYSPDLIPQQIVEYMKYGKHAPAASSPKKEAVQPVSGGDSPNVNGAGAAAASAAGSHGDETIELKVLGLAEGNKVTFYYKSGKDIRPLDPIQYGDTLYMSESLYGLAQKQSRKLVLAIKAGEVDQAYVVDAPENGATIDLNALGGSLPMAAAYQKAGFIPASPQAENSQVEPSSPPASVTPADTEPQTQAPAQRTLWVECREKGSAVVERKVTIKYQFWKDGKKFGEPQQFENDLQREKVIVIPESADGIGFAVVDRSGKGLNYGNPHYDLTNEEKQTFVLEGIRRKTHETVSIPESVIVYDTNGKAVAGATVTLTANPSGEKQEFKSTSSGTVRFGESAKFPVGTKRVGVLITAKGYDTPTEMGYELGKLRLLRLERLKPQYDNRKGSIAVRTRVSGESTPVEDDLKVVIRYTDPDGKPVSLEVTRNYDKKAKAFTYDINCKQGTPVTVQVDATLYAGYKGELKPVIDLKQIRPRLFLVFNPNDQLNRGAIADTPGAADDFKERFVDLAGRLEGPKWSRYFGETNVYLVSRGAPPIPIVKKGGAQTKYTNSDKAKIKSQISLTRGVVTYSEVIDYVTEFMSAYEYDDSVRYKAVLVYLLGAPTAPPITPELLDLDQQLQENRIFAVIGQYAVANIQDFSGLGAMNFRLFEFLINEQYLKDHYDSSFRTIEDQLAQSVRPKAN